MKKLMNLATKTRKFFIYCFFNNFKKFFQEKTILESKSQFKNPVIRFLNWLLLYSKTFNNYIAFGKVSPAFIKLVPLLLFSLTYSHQGFELLLLRQLFSQSMLAQLENR